MRRFFTVIILGIVIIVVSVLFAQFLGSFYIYNLVVEDNPPVSQDKHVKVTVPLPPKKKVLRLDPIEFYTIQVGIFPEAKSAQSSLDKLASIGLRPFISSQPPYKIWVGCFSDMNSGKEWENRLKKQGFEVFIGKGIINDRALKFPGDNEFMIDYLAPLLGKFDIILDHSLKMFQSPQIATYNTEVWENVIRKMQGEVVEGLMSINEILELPESFVYQNELSKLKEKAEAYGQGLNTIITSKNDEGVLYSQGHLLELVAAYHNLINQANEKLNTN